MSRAFVVGVTIVAAFQLGLAAAPAVVDDVVVTPPVAALAFRSGVDPLRDPTGFISEMARALYASADARPPDLSTRPVVRPRAADEALVTVPVPISAAVWGAAVFGRAVPPDALLATILTDRRATLLCRGLSGLDEETLTYVASHPAILTMLYQRAAGVFAAFGQALRIRDGRVITPGGDAFAPLWAAVADAPVDRPDRFIRAAFAEFEGRLAYLLDTIDAAPPAAARFALGAWLPEAARLPRFKALMSAVSGGYHEWRPADRPFGRPLGDLAMLLLRIRLTEAGGPVAPADRSFWRAALGTDGGDLLSGNTVDAAWIVAATGGEDMHSRLERLDQLAFAQRVFAGTDAGSESAVVDVIRHLRRYKMLMLTLERMGVTTADVYGSVLQRAAALSDVSDAHRFWTLAQFQGALAFVSSLQRNGRLDHALTEALVKSLAAVPQNSDGYSGALARWWQGQVAPVLPAGVSWESRAIDALAGSGALGTETHLQWEGQRYRVDLAFAERQRLLAVREKQGGQTLDIALTIHDVSEQLRSDALTIAGVRAAEQALNTLVRESAGRLRYPAVNLSPPGVGLPRDALTWVTEASRRLARITKPNDARRGREVGESLVPLTDIVLGNALISLAYSAALGDPSGAALLAGNVALRHDFGLGRTDSEGRERLPWAPPRQEFQPGVPWHVTGSILSLDLGLAALSLTRPSLDRVADPPKLSSIDREALAVNVALLDPRRLHDDDRDAIARAMSRGQARVAALPADPALVPPIVSELGLDGYRQRSLEYVLARTPARVQDAFTTADLVVLGGGSTPELDAWGTASMNSLGCACLTAPSSRAWRVLDGRSQLSIVATTMGDLNLRMAIMLRDLSVPTVLLKSVLAIAMQEVIDTLGDRGDWWGVAAAARALTRQRVEDYVSAAAAVDGPLVPIDDAPSSGTRAH